MIARESIEPEFARNLVRGAAVRWGIQNLVFVRYFENAVYAALQNGRTVYLRITPRERRSFEEVKSEIEILNYLEKFDFPSNRSIAAKDGSQVIRFRDSGREYFFTLFTECQGTEVRSTASLDMGLIKACGKTMGSLHKLLHDFGSQYSHARVNWNDDRWPNFGQTIPLSEKEAWVAHTEISDWWKTLATTTDTQLIHGDFTIRNFRYNGTRVSLFDFDGCCNHYRGYEIACFLHHFRTLPLYVRSAIASNFLKGYSETYDLSKDFLESLPMFSKMKLLRSMQVLCEELGKETRENLMNVLDQRRKELSEPSPWRSALGG